MAELVFKIEDLSGSAGRSVAYDNEKVAGEVTFSKAGEKTLIIDHTEVDDQYRGQKLGERLVKQVVDYATKEKKGIIPLCPFAKRVFDEHPEYRDTGK